MNENSDAHPLAIGRQTVLRDRLADDAALFVQWQISGEWRYYDAPWEGFHTTLTPEQQAEITRRFLEKCAGPLPFPRQMAMIVTPAGKPLGWVNRYSYERFPEVWYVGIDICEDAHLNKGIGTEALALWVDYLFHNSTVHRLALATWSFNPRMLRVAEKAGFIREGAERELFQWEGQWLDRIHFGMLRQEWQARHDQEGPES